jgi:hypothetical protein
MDERIRINQPFRHLLDPEHARCCGRFPGGPVSSFVKRAFDRIAVAELSRAQQNNYFTQHTAARGPAKTEKRRLHLGGEVGDG